MSEDLEHARNSRDKVSDCTGVIVPPLLIATKDEDIRSKNKKGSLPNRRKAALEYVFIKEMILGRKRRARRKAITLREYGLVETQDCILGAKLNP